MKDGLERTNFRLYRSGSTIVAHVKNDDEVRLDKIHEIVSTFENHKLAKKFVSVEHFSDNNNKHI
jgi:hypothetical protein